MSRTEKAFMALAWAAFSVVVSFLIVALFILSAMAFRVIPFRGPPGWLGGIEAAAAAIMFVGIFGSTACMEWRLRR